MAESPYKNSCGTVGCTVYSDGTAVGAPFGLVSVHIFTAVNSIGRALLVYRAGDPAAGSVPEADDDTFSIGNQVKVEAGYGDDAAILFEGVVTGQNIDIRAGEGCLFEVECSDRAFLLSTVRRSRVFTESKDSDAVSTILGNYDLGSEVEGTAVEHPSIVQYDCTDWEFIRSLANRSGLAVTVRSGNVKVAKPTVSGEAPLKVSYGPDLIEFRGELSATGQVAGVSASSWDEATQEMVVRQGISPALNKQGESGGTDLAGLAGIAGDTLRTVWMNDPDGLEVWAGAALSGTGLARVTGYVKFPGSALAVPDSVMELNGFGRHMDGKAYIGSVEHSIVKGDWTTTVGMGLSREEEGEAVRARCRGILPGIGGLHIGKVLKLEGDPLDSGRIQVDIATVGSGNDSVWARMATGWSGDGYGQFLCPDIGDEVAVGFFAGDPSCPVVLGSMYSGPRRPPYELSDDNRIRGWVTKEGIALTFDDENKTAGIVTPAGNSVELDDKQKRIKFSDCNGNTLVLDEKGITIESSKEINVKAGTAVNVESGTALGFQAKTDLKMKGLNVEVKADAGLRAKGTATAELSASGTTTVKGGMVMIN
ncbi:MAG: type VI secretion system tip protein VgrG [Alistipes sp.]|nr:type VI secretion system tip protein VgrG [Alistipes sp.]